MRSRMEAVTSCRSKSVRPHDGHDTNSCTMDGREGKRSNGSRVRASHPSSRSQHGNNSMRLHDEADTNTCNTGWHESDENNANRGGV